MDIQVLYRQGVSIREISRQLGISKNTVKKYIRNNNQSPQYAQRKASISKLDPFKAYIQSRIAAAYPDWIPASVLFHEIVAQGFTGKVRIVSAFTSRLKPKLTIEPVVRFETDPGQQMQIDFTIIRRGEHTLKAFVATLGYSRASFVKFYDNERSEAWLDGIREAFVFFGGVTKQVLCDNAKTIIIERDAYDEGKHRWHPALLDLANAYGFQPKVCRPYRAQTKGKVERFNHYLKNSFITPLNATFRSQGLILDVTSANAAIGSWLSTVANERIHGTTGEKPNVLLDKERHEFIGLPMTVIASSTMPPTEASFPMPYESIQHPVNIYDACIPRMAA